MLLIITFVAILALGITDAKQPTITTSPPVLAVTYHSAKKGDAANVYLYYLNGSALGTDKSPQYLIDMNSAIYHRLDEIRGLYYNGTGIYIANGRTAASRILYYNNLCNAQHQIPSHAGTLTEITRNMLDHPYDLTEHRGRMYVSNQNAPYMGIVSFPIGNPADTVQEVSLTESPRGFAFDKYDRLWVCADLGNAMYIYSNATTRVLIKSFVLIAPIAIRYDKHANYMLITNNDKFGTRVYVYDVETFAMVKAVQHDALEHGSGIVSRNNTWYVLSRNTNSLLSLDMTTMEMTVLNANLLKEPEQLFIVDC